MKKLLVTLLLIIGAPAYTPYNDLRIRNKPTLTKYQWYKRKFRDKGIKYTKSFTRKQRYER